MRIDRVEPIVPDRFSIVLVDFDHTLLGANSTELFIRHARPHWMASLFDIALRKIVPWRWLVGRKVAGRFRDYACVWAIIVAMPWTMFAWRRKAPSLFEENKSHSVERLLSRCDPGKVSIITFGFSPVVSALIVESRWAQSKLVATPFRASIDDLKTSKADIAKRHFAREAIESAFFVTDSDDDTDLLASVECGLKIVPQGTPDMGRPETYLPMKYAALVKYGRSYALDQFFFVDLCMWVLSIRLAMNSLFLSVFVAGSLLLSLSCVYEIGYYENDIEAAKEKNPVLTGKEWKYVDYPIRFYAWLWACALMVIAEAALAIKTNLSGPDAVRLAACWMILLIFLRILFHFYNKLLVGLRLFVYPLLQAVKYFAPLIFFSLSTAGFCLLLSQVVVMSVNYTGYRLCGRRKFIDREKWRGLIFGLLCLFLIANGTSLGPSLSIIFIIFWLALRASKPFIVALFRAKSTASGRALES